MERVLVIIGIILFVVSGITGVVCFLLVIHNNEDEIERGGTAVINYVSEKYNNFVEEYGD